MNRLEGAGSTYNVPVVVRFGPGLEVGVLESALADVVERHEVLRTVYGESGGEPHQTVLGPRLHRCGQVRSGGRVHRASG
ncbi:condensation domain protein [Nocardiopsis alba ATCC BAA-2165]|uniref:Condensation domain protein n=1 Tax=Nocardiopsis alba (strain ATCC BAA-2165 / BE74) TaxID=1205910 RepID=J7L804_NOCAA|nr:condensation domain protein [Nocardiopsis alba ATCC BAA-2165]